MKRVLLILVGFTLAGCKVGGQGIEDVVSRVISDEKDNSVFSIADLDGTVFTQFSGSSDIHTFRFIIENEETGEGTVEHVYLTLDNTPSDPEDGINTQEITSVQIVDEELFQIETTEETFVFEWLSDTVVVDENGSWYQIR